jgi:FdhD protein
MFVPTSYDRESDSNVSQTVPGLRKVSVHRLDAAAPQDDWVAEEVPVALVYNGISHAVMMATPADLEDFAVGFSLTEGIVPDLSHVYSVEVKPACRGIEVAIEISQERFWALKTHRRSMVGRTGCGICGTESLDGLARVSRRLEKTQTFDMRHYERAMGYLHDVETIGSLSGCTHAAVWVGSDGQFVCGAEDVGRHVALDKLLGKRASLGITDGVLVVSSRASYEMIQKAAMCGVEVIFAVSAPTAMAIDLAERTGVTLAAFCRNGRCSVYTHPDRLLGL